MVARCEIVFLFGGRRDNDGHASEHGVNPDTPEHFEAGAGVEFEVEQGHDLWARGMERHSEGQKGASRRKAAYDAVKKPPTGRLRSRF